MTLRVVSGNRGTQDFDDSGPKISPGTIGCPSRVTRYGLVWWPLHFHVEPPPHLHSSGPFLLATKWINSVIGHRSVGVEGKERQGGAWEGTWQRCPKWDLRANVKSCFHGKAIYIAFMLSVLLSPLLGLAMFFCPSASTSVVCWLRGDPYGESNTFGL